MLTLGKLLVEDGRILSAGRFSVQWNISGVNAREMVQEQLFFDLVSPIAANGQNWTLTVKRRGQIDCPVISLFDKNHTLCIEVNRRNVNLQWIRINPQLASSLILTGSLGRSAFLGSIEIRSQFYPVSHTNFLLRWILLNIAL